MKKITKLLLVLLLLVISVTTIVACDTNTTDFVPVESISIIGADSVIKDNQEQYTAIITPDNATEKTVIWEIESGTAEISDRGVLLSPEIGTVIIKATVDDISTTKQITITNPTPSDEPPDPLNATFNGFEKLNDTTYQIKVSNTTESLNIANIATISSDWKLTTNMQASNEIPSKIATPLNIGDNNFYVLVTHQNNVRLYTLKIRRKPIYEVTFNTNGGNLIDTQYIEEDSFMAAPDEPNKTGYKFVSWDKDITAPILQKTSFSAIWQAVTYNISYNLVDSMNGNNPSTYNIETESIVLEDAEKCGFIFDGWYLDCEFTQPIKSIPKGNYGDIELYAKFKPEPQILSVPTIEWDDILDIITVTNTDKNADNVVVTVNGSQRAMTKNNNVFSSKLSYSEYVGQIITISAYATSSDTENYTESNVTNYTSPFINRNFTKIKDPSVNWGASSEIFMIYLYREKVNYTISYDGIVIMENNVFVNNNIVGQLTSIPGVVTSQTDFDRYGYKFSPFSPYSGKTLTITFSLKGTVNENAIQQYYFESEIVTFTIPE